MPDTTKTNNEATLPSLSVLQLRRLAEKASGLRDEPLVMAYQSTGQGGEQWDLMSPENAAERPEPRIPIEPMSAGPGRNQWGKMDSVEVTYGEEGRKKHDDLVTLKCDAAFWSQAAIEKFVISYYLPLLEPAKWLSLYLRVKGIIVGAKVYGVIHTYPSIEGLLTDEKTFFYTEHGIQSETEFLSASVDAFIASPLGQAWIELL